MSGVWSISVQEEEDVMDSELTARDNQTTSLPMSKGAASSSKTIYSLEPEKIFVKKARKMRKAERNDDTQSEAATFYTSQGVSAAFQVQIGLGDELAASF